MRLIRRQNSLPLRSTLCGGQAFSVDGIGARAGRCVVSCVLVPNGATFTFQPLRGFLGSLKKTPFLLNVRCRILATSLFDTLTIAERRSGCSRKYTQSRARKIPARSNVSTMSSLVVSSGIAGRYRSVPAAKSFRLSIGVAPDRIILAAPNRAGDIVENKTARAYRKAFRSRRTCAQGDRALRSPAV